MRTGTHERGSNKQRFGVGMGTVKLKSGKEERRPFFTMRVPEGTPNAKTYTDAAGAVVTGQDGKPLWRVETTYLEGNITALSVRENKEGFGQGPVMYLEIEFDGEGVLSLREGDRYWSNFLIKLPLIDLAKPVWLTPYNFETTDGTKQVGLDIRQNPAEPNGTKVPSAFGITPAPERKKFAPEGMAPLPEPEKKMVNRKEVYDWTLRDKYLINEVLNPTAQLLKEKSAMQIPVVSGEPIDDGSGMEDGSAPAAPGEMDDLPF